MSLTRRLRHLSACVAHLGAGLATGRLSIGHPAMIIRCRNKAWRQSICFIAIRFGMGALLLIGMAGVSVASTEKCPQNVAMKAMSEASNLKTWSAVFKSYKRYKQCDDGAVAEGYSASVADLLANHWADTGKLVTLSNANPDFGRFVLRHVDETMSMDQGKSIKDSATNNCSAKAKKFCREIQKRFMELDAFDAQKK